MPFDPAKPADQAELIAAELRAQFSGLHDEIQTIPQGPQGPPGEVTQSQLSNDLVNTQNAAVNTAMSLSSANSNGVQTLDISISDPDTEAVRQKLNELIVALRR